MTLKVNFKIFDDAKIVTRIDEGIGMTTLQHDVDYAGIGDADSGINGYGGDTVRAYVDLDPDPGDPERVFIGLDLEGNRADYEKLIADLQSLIDVNWPEVEDPCARCGHSAKAHGGGEGEGEYPDLPCDDCDCDRWTDES